MSYSYQANLATLDDSKDFIARHIGPTTAQQQTMLSYLGYQTLDELIKKTIPKDVLNQTPIAVAPSVNENHALAQLREIASTNQQLLSCYGCGYYPTSMPSVLRRNVLENPNWYTAYTPYQAEISQGRLSLLLNYQQMIIELTGLEIANASLLDEATAMAESVTMAHAANRKKAACVLVHKDIHPQTLAVLRTRCKPLCITIETFTDSLPHTDAFAMVVQYPNTYGVIDNPRALVAQATAANIIPIAITDPLALVLLASPADLGFSIAVGSSQRFGIPMGYGGPHAAYIACDEKFKRVLPGRVIGVSQDSRGKTALRMALQTREQHIRREKATSNICTAQVLLANLAVLYAMHYGQHGIHRIALRTHRYARIFALAAQQQGCQLLESPQGIFDTVTLLLADDTQAQQLAQQALAENILIRTVGEKAIISFHESIGEKECKLLISTLLKCDTSVAQLEQQLDSHQPDQENSANSALGQFHAIHPTMHREQLPLNHRIFADFTNETAMMRYLKSMQDKDLSLTHSMIPLGSCTMKLNAAAELEALSWPELGNLHPFAPKQSVKGMMQIIQDVESSLCAISGFAKVSVQPNSGAQGEYAGLMAIRGYHHARGDHKRNLCLIPSSAHGTNPASAVMSGMKVKVIACDEKGNVHLDDLISQAEQNCDTLAALMITYPSTHGVFEQDIRAICDTVHANGGLVYMDGANTNALLGLVRPPEIGADVMHFNLHKTFCIPHGGGGPGVGPIGVTQQLAPFLPGHPHIDDGQPVAAAPYGSALILSITWMYIRMMGGNGLAQSGRVSLLNANYIAKRLSEHYPLLYTGNNGLVAHECILDIRPIKERSGISEEDIAKRLMDYGFHAPTMSFPVAGTLMIEPTESESLLEIERFCQAMIAIRGEITQVENGQYDVTDNPLIHAPHTLVDISGNWQRSYTREQACFPLPHLKEQKFWPSVNRIDNVLGDKNLICSCVGIDAYV